MNEIRYRTETAYGEGYRDAVDVMTYETYELGNTDILKTLSSEFFTRNQALQDQCNNLIDELEENGYVDDFSEEDWNQFFKTALQEIEKITGYKIHYVLWLADKGTALDPEEGYGQYIENENDIVAYKIGQIVLSDLGYDGTLYGYTEYPEPLVNKEFILKE